MKQKKFVPIWMLCARSTLPALVLVALLTAAVEIVSFVSAANPGLAVDAAVNNSLIAPALVVSFVLWTVVLSMPGLNRAAHTLDRLPSTHLQQGLCRTAYNFLCYLIFWGMQLAVILGLCLWFSDWAEPGAFGPQSVLLLFYRNSLLHLLMPLHNWTLNLRVLGALLAFSAIAAYPNHYRGRPLTGCITAAAAGLILMYTLTFHSTPLADIGLGLAALMLAAGLLFWQDAGSLYTEEAEPHEKM